MKEVTEWDGKPRWMWVWDDREYDKKKQFVVYILTKEDMKLCGAKFPVKCGAGMGYTHCAEIEEEKRPCTGEELLEMLKKQGLPFLQRRKAVFNLVAVACISTSSVEMSNGDYFPYDGLCQHYTLLDGTELWKEN